MANPIQVSNLASLDETTLEYIRLCHERKQFAKKVSEIDARLKQLKEPLLKRFMDGQPAVHICPSPEEESVFGAIGSLCMKTKNQYEPLNRENLNRLIKEYVEYLLEKSNVNREQVAALGEGIASFIWRMRKKNVHQYVEREFVVKKARAASKRDPKDAPKKKKSKTTEPTIIPQTREDFFAINGFEDALFENNGGDGGDQEPLGEQ